MKKFKKKKFEHHWVGPYTIVSKPNDVNVGYMDVRNHYDTIHVDNIKRSNEHEPRLLPALQAAHDADGNPILPTHDANGDPIFPIRGLWDDINMNEPLTEDSEEEAPIIPDRQVLIIPDRHLLVESDIESDIESDNSDIREQNLSSEQSYDEKIESPLVKTSKGRVIKKPARYLD